MGELCVSIHIQFSTTLPLPITKNVTFVNQDTLVLGVRWLDEKIVGAVRKLPTMKGWSSSMSLSGKEGQESLLTVLMI